jgi:hypothetical protein
MCHKTKLTSSPTNQVQMHRKRKRKVDRSGEKRFRKFLLLSHQPISSSSVCSWCTISPHYNKKANGCGVFHFSGLDDPSYLGREKLFLRIALRSVWFCFFFCLRYRFEDVPDRAKQREKKSSKESKKKPAPHYSDNILSSHLRRAVHDFSSRTLIDDESESLLSICNVHCRYMRATQTQFARNARWRSGVSGRRRNKKQLSILFFFCCLSSGACFAFSPYNKRAEKIAHNLLFAS